jgi:hypothetical protein
VTVSDISGGGSAASVTWLREFTDGRALFSRQSRWVVANRAGVFPAFASRDRGLNRSGVLPWMDGEGGRLLRRRLDVTPSHANFAETTAMPAGARPEVPPGFAVEIVA